MTHDQLLESPPTPAPAATPTSDGPPAAADSSVRPRRFGLGIQSKLLAMLLAVGLLSALTIGYVGYHSGTTSLQAAAQQQLIEIRQSRARELSAYFDGLKSSLIISSRGATAIQAMQGFTAGFDELESRPIDPKRAATVSKYYNDVFVPEYEARTGTQTTADAFLPTTPAQTYLQSTYTASSTDFDQKLTLDDAGDGSAWSATHARYQDYFREMVNQYGYEDVFLVDPRGNVVFSAYKGVDLGTNISTGPYRGGNFQSAFDAALHSNSVDYFGLTDFERYQPSYGVPTGFAASPVGSGGRIDGVLVVQLPLERINSLMTGNGGWVADGLGQSGETYIVGPDQLMRSTSRELQEHPEVYREKAIEAGTPKAAADRAVEVKGSVLIQPVDNADSDAALRGQTGTSVGPNYLGTETLTAYAPLDIPGLQWVIIADLSTDEAYAPVRTFARNMAIAIGALVLLICLASLLLAQVFTRPIKRLVTATQSVAAGDLDTRVPVTSRDEFGELGVAFNDMGRSLRTKAELLSEQQAENERLLLSLMPEDVARRYREGEETIAREHANVSVVFADVVGLDELTRGLDSQAALTLTNQLVRGFEDAAERTGVEKVRVLRNGYLASCGLVTPRLDNARRTVEFAKAAQLVIDRFNAQHGAQLALRAGIDTGSVSSGLVGRSSVVYDMWGDAVNLAYQVRNAGGKPGIFVTGRVYDRLRNEYTFSEAAGGDGQPGRQPVWALDSELTHA